VSDLSEAFNTNVLGPIVTTNAFLPLLRKGSLKKVITINSGLADPQLSLKGEIANFNAHSISKSALEMVNVKYAGESSSFFSSLLTNATYEQLH
jgi:NAD(P)-dependent dehydrogenase (short-subunit alcohol dehydrogenase family)